MTIISKSKAIFVRLLFGAHGTLAVIVLATITEVKWFWFAECLVVVSLLETFVTLKVNKHAEWKWFLPSVFLYLLWIVPPIVLLEYYALDYRQFRLDMSDSKICFVDFNDRCASQNVTDDETSNGVLTQETYDEARHYGLIFQQTMMLVLIGGRWLGPKGSLTRDQLSQLLLALTGMAADMLEFVTETVKLEETACNQLLVYIIMGIWAWSLLQFTLGLTATKQKKTRVVSSGQGISYNPITSIAACCETEMWALMISVIMQDGPYLTMRLYIMFTVNNFGQTMIFFTAKNGILFLLQVYRLYVVVIERRKAGKAGHSKRADDEDGVCFKVKEARTPTTPIDRPIL